MLLAALTVVLFLAWYVFVTAERLETPAQPNGPGAAGTALPASTRLVLAGTGASGHIVLTCLAFGVTGLLMIDAVAPAVLLTAGGLLALGLRSREHRLRTAEITKSDLRAIARVVREALGWETVVLASLLLFAGIWLTTVVVTYSPRGVDDIVYHLPPVYQAVQTHRFEILPLELRQFFAFPFNAEMLFLWVTLLTGSVRWVDGTQVLAAALAITAVFALGRGFGLRPRGAFFAAVLFGAMPVVILQSVSNYTDLILNAWVLAAAVALLAYERSGSRVALAVGGLATGLLLGSKYQSILFAALFTGIALIAAYRRGLRGARWLGAGALFALPAAIAGLYWYLRNWMVFSNPFFPLPVSIFGITLFPGDWKQGASVWSAVLKNPIQLLRIAVWDPGLRSFNGGFGFTFWGLGLAAWVRLLVQRVREGPRPPRLSTPLLLLGLVPVGLFSLGLVPYDDLSFTPRYVLAIGGIAFVALAIAIEEAAPSRTGAATMMRAAGVLGAALAIVVAAASDKPVVDMSYAARYSPNARRLGEMVYLRHGPSVIGWMAEAWAPLDAITRGDAGMTVYQATDYGWFLTAPTYGSSLQNRIWNFAGDRDRQSDPDAYFYHSVSGSPLYIGKEIHRETVAADPRYELVSARSDDTTGLYVSRSRLAEKGRRERLVDFYRTLRPTMVRETAPAAEAVRGGILLATFPLASAFLVHEAEGRLHAELIPVMRADIEAEAARRSHVPVYTLGVPVGGRRSRAVQEVGVSGRKITLFVNEPVSPKGAADAPADDAGSRSGEGDR